MDVARRASCTRGDLLVGRRRQAQEAIGLALEGRDRDRPQPRTAAKLLAAFGDVDMRRARDRRRPVEALDALDRRDLRVTHRAGPRHRRRAPRSRYRSRAWPGRAACRAHAARCDRAAGQARSQVSACSGPPSTTMWSTSQLSRPRPQAQTSTSMRSFWTSAPAVRNSPPLGTVPICQASRRS